MTALLRLDGVTVRRGAAAVLEDVSFDVAAGEAVALLGPSGSGKTTVLRVLLGLLPPDAGTVSIRGAVASEPGRVVVPPEERGLSVVFQDLALWPHLTVAGNLRFVLRSRRAPRDGEDARIAEMLARVDLAGMERRYPGELSGGEQQRVAVARALVAQPDAVLLDEPLSGLGGDLRRDVLDLFAALIHERGTTAVYVTHQPDDADALGARTLRLERGRLVG